MPLQASEELRALTSFKEARGSAERSGLQYVAITRRSLRALANHVALLEKGQCPTCAEPLEDEVIPKAGETRPGAPRRMPDPDILPPRSPSDLPPATGHASANYDEQWNG